MRLSRKKAIELCIDLWTWCTRTGKDKEDWPRWEKYKNYAVPKNSGILHKCWFCEYNYQKTRSSGRDKCSLCPYYKKYGYCHNAYGYYHNANEGLSYYLLWENATEIEDRKKYAKLFLAQLKTLK